MEHEDAPSGRALAKLMAVREQTVSEWRAGSYRPEGADLVRLASILHVPTESLRQDDEGYVVATGNAARVREPAAAYEARTAELRGRSIEVEALLAYALERQRLLTQSLGEAATLTPNATPEELEAATARQLQADAEAGRGKAREA